MAEYKFGTNEKNLLLENMENFVPVIPEEVVDFYLKKSGFNCPDPTVRRFVALATQKFMTEVAHDSMQYCKLRQASSKRRNLVLTTDDLSNSLSEYGINVNKPPYHQ
eukprot:TRINITY_DN6716_c0_g1_i1.p1 TRINITY_DN6716_c0_g1~~TRINITY_DN6716_c0_g1_i1.p1  ORF type:complete len:107 (-),score=27.60 TRINITY_DN6716_c0_g1_i1:52-372(-)